MTAATIGQERLERPAEGEDTARRAPHGTVARYTTRGGAGCRCSECRAAMAAYQRERRERIMAGRPVVDRRRFSFADLERMLVVESDVELLRRLGLCGNVQLYRWRRTGLTVEQADVLAIRAGFHPAEVWSSW